MPVSLKKPPKVDLSKPPIEPVPIREITPEHILEEYTPFEERVITPIHTKSEEVPREEHSIIAKFKRNDGDDGFLQYELFGIHLPFRAIVLIMVLISAATIVIFVATLYSLVGRSFDNSIISLTFGLALFFSLFRLVKRVFFDIDD